MPILWNGDELPPPRLQKPKPHVFDKRDEQRDLATRVLAVRRAVRARDGRRCRCCGGRENLHMHHLTYRSQGGKWETSNIVSLCTYCHSLLHAKQLWILGKDADKRLTFEIDERAVVELFGAKELPRHVHIVKAHR